MENVDRKEQTEITSAANAAINGKENSFGKFKSLEAIIEAYKSLEAEFTRRSQKLKELQGELDGYKLGRKWEKKARELNETFPVAKRYADEIAAEVASNPALMEKENCLEIALMNVLSKKADEANVGANLAETVESGTESAVNATEKDVETAPEITAESDDETAPNVGADGGLSPALKPIKPRTISEAGLLALGYLKNRKQ